jgi:transcription elongation factor Elf1
MPRPVVEFYLQAIELRERLENSGTGATSEEEGLGRLLTPDKLPVSSLSKITLNTEECAAGLQPFFALTVGEHPVFQHQLKAVRDLLEKNGRVKDDLFHLAAAGNYCRVEEIAFAAGCDAGLLGFVVRSALRTGLAPGLKRQAQGCDFSSWRRGNCPACGSKSHLGYVSADEKDKTLCCSFCGQQWTVDISLCPFCGTAEAETEKVEVKALEHMWAEACRKCGSYIKIMDTRASLFTGKPSIDDLASMHLDYIAASEGYTRPIPAPA